MATTVSAPATGALSETGTDAPAAAAGEPPVLVPAAVTAARERARLELAAGRTGQARWLAGVVQALRHLGSAEAAERGLRYRPVAWTVIAVVAVALYLPGRADSPAAPAAPAPAAVTPAPPSAPAPAADPAPPDLAPAAPVPTFAPDRSVAAPPPVAVVPRATSAREPAPPAAASTPLTVRGFGWANRLPPAPLPVDEVADGTAPVANRLGSVDRVSFLRLEGDTNTLVLEEHGDSAREVLGPAMVAACPIVDAAWSEEPGQSFDDVPQWDAESCVGGSEDDGTWTFDLGAFSDPTGDAGIALVPTTEAPADFQIAFVVAD